jgi:glutaredoxin 3
MAADVILYTIDACPYCELARALLRKRGISYAEVVVDMQDDARWQALVQRSGLRKMPQIFVGDVAVGGYADLKALDAMDELASLDGKRR